MTRDMGRRSGEVSDLLQTGLLDTFGGREILSK